MLIFGHVGLTMAIVRTCEYAAEGKSKRYNDNIDYRIVILGALLPDIIDKPLVQALYGLNAHSGHFIGHSFLFSGALIIIGIISLLRGRKNSVLLLGVGSLIHQILDKLMLLPNVFLLPVLKKGSSIIPQQLYFLHGVTEPIYRTVPYLGEVKLYLMEPYVYIPEVIGFLIIVYFICRLIINKSIIKFLRSGRL